MNTPTPERRRAERLPGNGAKGALATQRGVIPCEVLNWSNTGALVRADGQNLAGTRVVLRAKGPDGILEKRAMVIYVTTNGEIAIEFEPEEPRRPRESRNFISWIMQFFRGRPSHSTD